MSSHATNSPSPATLMSISANNLSVLACRDATSSEHQSSSLHPRLVFFSHSTGLQVSATGPHSHRHQRAERHFGIQLFAPPKNQPTTHCSPLLSDIKDGLENSLLSPYMYIFSV